MAPSSGHPGGRSRSAEDGVRIPRRRCSRAQDTLEWSLRHRGPDSPMTLDAKGERRPETGAPRPFRRRPGPQGRGRRPPGEVRWEADDPTRWRPRRCRGSTSIDWVDMPRRCPFSSTSWRHAAAPSGEMTCRTCQRWSGWGARCAIWGTSPGPVASCKRRWSATRRQGAGETEDCMKALSHLATTLAQLELVHEACARSAAVSSTFGTGPGVPTIPERWLPSRTSPPPCCGCTSSMRQT